MRNREDRNLLEYMIKEIGDIEDFVSGVSENEFIKNVEEYHTIPWRAVYGFRTIVAHEYHNVDMERVWLMIEDDVPQLKELILVAL